MTRAAEQAAPGPDRWDAVVLAGGASRRMGGRDKVALDVGGRTMLDRVLAAGEGAACTVVVGPPRQTSRPVVWCVEQPAGGGPAAAVGAGLEHVSAPVVVLLAGDQPLLDPSTVHRLLAAVGAAGDGLDGAVAVDDEDAPQWLCSAWWTTSLRASPLAPDTSMRAALGALRWGRVPVGPAAAMDCDTPDDLRRARELAR
jgi:molybdopterin-guanine dinucleotide biosynthesis protein A